jgi:hypothetical protein
MAPHDERPSTASFPPADRADAATGDDSQPDEAAAYADALLDVPVETASPPEDDYEPL